jgi:hypothetical protein
MMAEKDVHFARTSGVLARKGILSVRHGMESDRDSCSRFAAGMASILLPRLTPRWMSGTTACCDAD